MYPGSIAAVRAAASPAALALCILLAADAALLAFHMAVVAGVLSDARLLITTERGVAETLQYAKAAAAAWLLLSVFRHTRSATALVWSAGLFGLLIDDAFAVHERAGTALGPLLFPSHPGPLAPEHAAEFLFMASGAALFAATAVAVAAREGRRGWVINTALGGALGLLALFAIVVDALHSSASSMFARRVLAILEDGGEMVALTALTALAGALAAQARASRRT